jgi:D-inositol-3-phosphate glycosyltransferase
VATSLLPIAFVCFHTSPTDPPGTGDAGGMNVYVDQLARALGQLGVTVDVFTRAAEAPSVEVVACGVRTIALPVGPPGPLAKEALPPHARAFAGAVMAFARREGIAYSVVHSHYWQSGLAAIRLAHQWRVPLVHMHHTLGEMKNAARAAGTSSESDVRLRVEGAVAAAAGLVTASTDEERRRIGGHNVRTLPPGVDHRLFHPGDLSAARASFDLGDEPVFLAACRIQPLKGLELAVRGLSLVGRSSELLVSGGPSGPDGEAELGRLLRLAVSLGVQRRVRFLGPLPQPRLADLYRASDALIVTSHSESFGLAALEAHASGTPVVGTAVGGLATFVHSGRSGFLIDRRDPELLAARLRDVLVAGDAFRHAAAASADAFSWERTARAVLDDYLRLAPVTHHRKMRLKASPCATPMVAPTTAKRRVNQSRNRVCPSSPARSKRKADEN